MMGRGRGQPAAGREGIIGTSTCDGAGKGTASCREGGTSTCDGEGEGTSSCREGRTSTCDGEGRGQPAAGREGPAHVMGRGGDIQLQGGKDQHM